jgi:hypothetical protein
LKPKKIIAKEMKVLIIKKSLKYLTPKPLKALAILKLIGFNVE